MPAARVALGLDGDGVFVGRPDDLNARVRRSFAALVLSSIAALVLSSIGEVGGFPETLAR